jgi:two-component system chemotaxis response regulator CheY
MFADTPSLLITDDDLDFRETLRAVFEPRGFRTLLAADGNEAMNIVLTTPVHLMLLDLHMPRMGGFDTLRQLRQHRALLPCIVMSAGLDEQVRARLEEDRPFSILAKPVSRDQVTTTVAQAMWQTYQWRRE